MVPTQIGTYQISRQRAHRFGGNAYEARDVAQGRKVVLSECPGDWPLEEILETLDENARVFTLLEHPNVERVIGFVRRDQAVYLVTELVEGSTLEEILRERRTIPMAMALRLFRQVLSGMAAGHRLGIVHGCLNPTNVAIPSFGPVKILNVAFAHAFRPEPPLDARQYRAPEWTDGQTPDGRSDIYAIGMMLYEAIAGKGPFDAYGDFRAELPSASLVPMPLSMAQPEIPKWVDQLVCKMIAHDRLVRFSSVHAVVRFLDSHSKASAETAESSIAEPRSRIATQTPVTRGNSMSVRSVVPSAALNRTATPKRQLALPPMRKAMGIAAMFILTAGELVLFRGTHISGLVETRGGSKASLNESVDEMFARLPSPPVGGVLPTTGPERHVRMEPERHERGAAPIAEKKPVASRKAQPPSDTAFRKVEPSFMPAASPREEPKLALTPRPPPVQPAEAQEPAAVAPVITAQNKASTARLEIAWEN